MYVWALRHGNGIEVSMYVLICTVKEEAAKKGKAKN